VKKDQKFPAAWNNLGVVLMEKGETAEAMEVFKKAYALAAPCTLRNGAR